mgnify:CR=1 FL=1
MTAPLHSFLLFVAVLGALASSACGGCCRGSDIDPDPEETPAALEWTAPRNNATVFTDLDDLNEDRDGIQINVRLTYTGDDDELVLQVVHGDTTDEHTAVVEGNACEFVDVTLASSPDEDDPAESTMTVSATDVDDAVRTAFAFDARTVPSCGFLQPADGAQLVADGGTVSVVSRVECDGAGVEAGDIVEMTVGDDVVANESLDASLTAEAVVRLPGEAGSVELSAQIFDHPESAETITLHIQ